MKKVALFMDGWKRYFTYAWPLGFMQRVKETDEDVNLYVFNSNGNWNRDDGYSHSEYNIYNLPELSDFDGILLSVNNIKYPEVTGELVRRIRESGVPTISLETEFDGFYYVGVDNYAAMYDMTEHILREHGAQRVWYLAGPADNYEAGERYRAFRDCMEAYGRTVTDADVYFGDFGFGDGGRGLDKLLQKSGGFTDAELPDILPDAVICANDNLAVGVCSRAEKMGLTVPDDFLVTGFDNFDKAAYYKPRITTVSRIRERIGYEAANVLLDLWNGKMPERCTHVGYTCVFTESCGCRTDEKTDGREYLKGHIISMIEREEIDESLLDFTHMLSTCGDYRQLISCVPRSFSEYGSKRCVAAVDKKLLEMENAGTIGSTAADDDIFVTKGFPQRMKIVYESRDGAVLPEKNGDSDTYRGLFPMLEDETGGNIFLFAPFHFGDKTVGFCCVENGSYLMDKQLWSTVMNETNVSMENLFNKWRLTQINSELKRISIRDPLTQIYNREGYRQVAESVYQEALAHGDRMLVIFADLDRLKYINDTYGHEFGDAAIRCAARAIVSGSRLGSVSVRYGGDEFVSIFVYDEEESPEERKADILAKAAQIAREENLPFDVELSIGYVVTDPETPQSLDDYVRQADQRMYEEKLRRKTGR